MVTGVQLYLEPDTPIPEKIQKRRHERREASLYNRWVPLLIIPEGAAFFTSGGAVLVELPEYRKPIEAFESLRVLEIRDGRGKLVHHNYYLCFKCGMLSGVKIADGNSASTNGVIRQTAAFKCALCGRSWSNELR